MTANIMGLIGGFFLMGTSAVNLFYNPRFKYVIAWLVGFWLALGAVFL